MSPKGGSSGGGMSGGGRTGGGTSGSGTPGGDASGGSRSGTVARVTEISARSDKSFEDALRVGVNRAGTTLRNVTSAWVKEQRVDVKDGRIQGYQVNLLVTFVLDNE